MADAHRVVVNLGGEGEVAGAINVNNLSLPLRPPERIRARGPLVVADARRLPVRSGVADAVVTRRFPIFGTEGLAEIATEAFRILRAGGYFRFHRSSGDPGSVVPYLEAAGFAAATVEGVFAVGVKP